MPVEHPVISQRAMSGLLGQATQVAALAGRELGRPPSGVDTQEIRQLSLERVDLDHPARADRSWRGPPSGNSAIRRVRMPSSSPSVSIQLCTPGSVAAITNV